jgi:hypothetical protein
MLSWVAFAAGVLACLGVAYGTYQLAGYAWDQVVTYRSPYVRQQGAADTSPTTLWIPSELKPTFDSTTPVLARRVVLVIVDGMRVDVSRSQMNTLNRLRTYGSDIQLTVPQPSLSYPNWTTILSGAPQEISGVTTNWFKGRAPVPTVMDIAQEAGRRVEIVGPEDFATIYGVRPGANVSLRPWPKGGYLSGTLVDDTLRIAKTTDPQLIVLHLPDLDEAGHTYGGTSKQYLATAHRIDLDLSRLVTGLQRDDTAFIIVADHGHLATGGHGGWEPEVTTVPGVFAGAGIKLGSGTGQLEQIAATVSALEGVPTPPYAAGLTLRSVITTGAPIVYQRDRAHHVAFDAHMVDVITQGDSKINSRQLLSATPAAADSLVARARAERLAVERSQRIPGALIVLAVIVIVVGVLWVQSWRALVSALAGAAGYYAVYNALFFSQGFRWSLSTFNTETNVRAFMNGRMLDAVIAGVAAAAIAAAVYPLLRTSPRGPRDPWFLSGWLALGPAMVLVIEATLAIQVVWYGWWYGFSVSWTLPNFMWAFKADLDMVQMTALGAVAILAPVVTYLVGRYHPVIARVRAGDEVAGPKT